MFPKITRFAFLNSLQWINLLGAGSVAIFWSLGGNGIEPARATAPDPQVARLDLSQAQELTNLGESDQEEREVSRAAGEQAVEQPSAARVREETTVEPQPTEVADAPSAQMLVLEEQRTRFSFGGAALTLPEVPQASPSAQVLAGTADNPHWDLGQLTAASESSCAESTTCRFPISTEREKQKGERGKDNSPSSLIPKGDTEFPIAPYPLQGQRVPHSETLVVSPRRSNTTLAQLPPLPQTPSVLPVPATPIPASSKRANPRERQIPSLPQAPTSVPAMGFPAAPNPYNPTVGQLPYYPQAPTSVPATGFPASTNFYNPAVGQLPYYSQPPNSVPATGFQASPNSYYPSAGQFPYYPQAVILVPVPATGMPMSPNSYNPGFPYYPQAVILVPVPATGMPMSPNFYNPSVGQSPYYPQNVQPLPAPLNPGAVGFNNYNPSVGQSGYYPQNVQPLPAPLNPGAVGFNNYNPSVGQSGYYPQNVPPLPAPLNPGAVGFNNYNPSAGQSPYNPQSAPPLPLANGTPALLMMPVGSNGYNPSVGQSPYYPQNVPPLPAPLNPSSGVPNSYNPALGQSAYSPQAAPPLPVAPGVGIGSLQQNPNPQSPIANPQLGTTPATQQPTLNRTQAVTAPYLRLQGAYVNQGDLSGARARVTGLYPLNSRVQFGGTLDLISGENIFADSRRNGLNLNELYVATAPFENLPNFRLVAGQLDLTSYFDRNSFAKDAVTHFFNPVFQTNPALSATGIASRPGVLVNWSVTDNIEAKAAVFSSARDMGDFALDGFAGEIGIRYGNAIIRGTYASDRDAGSRDGFREIYSLSRGDGTTGIRSSDREQAYGVNFEYFFPELKMGLFGRYGRYDNRTLGRGGDTYSAGISFLDVFTSDDRLGIGYGRGLSNDLLRRNAKDDVPDVLELFYDFRFLPNVRLGFTLQQRDGFSETYGGFRVKTEFDVTPGGRLTP